MAAAPREWTGRGLDEVPDRPPDWAWMREREEIRRHIHAKLVHKHEMVGARRFWNTHRGRGVDHAIDRIQARIHRGKPKMVERQRRRDMERIVAGLRFTVEELAHIAEHFAGANDPVGQAILLRIGGMMGSDAPDQGVGAQDAP